MTSHSEISIPGFTAEQAGSLIKACSDMLDAAFDKAFQRYLGPLLQQGQAKQPPLEPVNGEKIAEKRMEKTVSSTPEVNGDAKVAEQLNIAVIGGGMSGLALAIGLAQRGITAQVYEGASVWEDNAGAGLIFARNGMEAMKKISSDIYEAFAKRSSGQGWESKKTTYMDFRNGATDGDLVTSVVCANTGQQSVHRGLFAKDLVSLLPEGSFHMGKKLVNLTTSDSGKYTLNFADGESADADVVVGGDGIKSKCRQILLGEDSLEVNPKFAKEFAYRGMVPMERAVAVLGEEFARNSQVHIGQDAVATTYPVENGTLLNLVACLPLEKWEHDEWIFPSNQEAAKKDFAGCGPVMQKIVSMMDRPFKWALFDHPECSTFYKGNFAIIGDAAHASTPHQGAGCGQAFEDALVMCNLLADETVKRPEHVEKAFAAYDAIRRPRTLKVVKTSRENGEITMSRGNGIENDFGKIKKAMDDRFDWIWYEDLDRQVEMAKAALHERLQVPKHVSVEA